MNYFTNPGRDGNHLPFSGLQQFMLHLHSLLHLIPSLKQGQRFVLQFPGAQPQFPLFCGLFCPVTLLCTSCIDTFGTSFSL